MLPPLIEGTHEMMKSSFDAAFHAAPGEASRERRSARQDRGWSGGQDRDQEYKPSLIYHVFRSRLWELGVREEEARISSPGKLPRTDAVHRPSTAGAACQVIGTTRHPLFDERHDRAGSFTCPTSPQAEHTTQAGSPGSPGCSAQPQESTKSDPRRVPLSRRIASKSLQQDELLLHG